MPIIPPPPYDSPPLEPDVGRRAVIQDSIQVERMRRQRRAAPPLRSPPQPPVDTVISASDDELDAGPAPLPQRLVAPLIIPTHVLHNNLPARREREEQNRVLRMIRRITVSENSLSPPAKADAVIEWLVHNGFMTMTSPNRASQLVSKFYGHDTSKSRLFEGDGVYMNTTMPWLRREQVAAIRTLLIDRVHANKADPRAAPASAQDCLIRYFRAVQEGRPPAPISAVRLRDSAQTLTRLSAFHMDDVYFDPDRCLAGGQQGSFFAGVTQRGYPVGIKCIYVRGEAESKAMRCLQVGGYLQAHHGKQLADPTWVVMPCYSGTLTELGPLFLEVPYKPREGQKGGLRGARYILQNLFGELAFLHDDMHGLHQDIKSSNIFVSQQQRRFVLGDFGLSSKLSIRGYAPYSGMTHGYASPEQAAENQHLTPASDVFSLCVTAINGILQADPAFCEAWKKVHGARPMPPRLFPHRALEMFPAFAAWSQFSDADDTLRQIHEEFELTQQGSIKGSEPDLAVSFREHFERIADVMLQLDAPLWGDLCRGLRMDPRTRPSAKELQESITISKGDRLACDAVWDKMAPYSPKIDEEVKRLKALLKKLEP